MDRDLPETDLHALEKLFSGEDRGWEELWTKYGPMIESKVRSYRLSPEDVEEVLQEISFLLVRDDFRVLRGWDPERSALKTYLRVIVSNMCINYIRSNFFRYQTRKRETPDEWISGLLDQSEPDPSERLQALETFERVREVFLDLFGSNHVTPSDRFLFQLRVNGYSYRRISSILRIDEGTIRKRFQRLKDQLVREMDKSRLMLSEREIRFLLSVTKEDF